MVQVIVADAAQQGLVEARQPQAVASDIMVRFIGIHIEQRVEIRILAQVDDPAVKH